MDKKTQLRKALNSWHLKLLILLDTKERLDSHEREIWWIKLGQNIGWEQNGKGDEFLRPALIVRKFHSDLMWAVPVTRTIRSGNYFHTLKATKCKGQLILPQMKPIDSVRLVKKIERIDEAQYLTVRKLIRRLL